MPLAKLLSPYKKILFRCDSASHIGIGHVMRDLVLASKLDADITFAVRELEGNINEKIPYKKISLLSNDVDELIKHLRDHAFDLLIIDHYGIDAQEERRIKEETGITLLAFDDTYTPHYADFILNHNIGAESKKYTSLTPAFCRALCGERYTLIREEFLSASQKKVRKKPKNTLFLSIGGSDHSGVTEKLLPLISKEFHIHLVTTTANRRLERLSRLPRERITLHVNTSEVALIMKKCSFALITPSVSVYEVMKMGTPFIAVKTASNQDDVYRNLRKKRLVVIEKFRRDKVRYLFSKSIR